eukprot:g23992.t1
MDGSQAEMARPASQKKYKRQSIIWERGNSRQDLNRYVDELSKGGLELTYQHAGPSQLHRSLARHPSQLHRSLARSSCIQVPASSTAPGDGSRRRQVASLLKEPVAGPQGSYLLGACVNELLQRGNSILRRGYSLQSKVHLTPRQSHILFGPGRLGLGLLELILGRWGLSVQICRFGGGPEPKSEPVVGAPQPEQASAGRGQTRPEQG